MNAWMSCFSVHANDFRNRFPISICWKQKQFSVVLWKSSLFILKHHLLSRSESKFPKHAFAQSTRTQAVSEAASGTCKGRELAVRPIDVGNNVSRETFCSHLIVFESAWVKCSARAVRYLKSKVEFWHSESCAVQDCGHSYNAANFHHVSTVEFC